MNTTELTWPGEPVAEADCARANKPRLTLTEIVELESKSHDVLSLDHQRWLQCYPDIPVSGIAANILANVELTNVTDDSLYFVLDQSQSSVYGDEILPKLAQILSKFFGRQLMVHIKIGSTEKETPAELSQRLKQERHSELVSDFEQDANVQQLLKRFSGTLAKDSIARLKIEETHD